MVEYPRDKRQRILDFPKTGLFFPLNETQTGSYHGYSLSRERILVRDNKVCQVLSCGSKRNLQVHHMVPECVVNNRNTRMGSSYYNDWFLKKHMIVLEYLKSDEREIFNCLLDRKVRHSVNALTICGFHHLKVHRERNMELFHLLPPNLSIIRPRTLRDEGVMSFFFVMLKDISFHTGIRFPMKDIFSEYFESVDQVKDYLYLSTSYYNQNS